MTGWEVERLSGAASRLFDRPEPEGRRVTFLDVTGPAVVLGSTQRRQPDQLADLERRGAGAGFDVVRRRSGGGAVWLEPGAQVWVDVFVPRGDPVWHDDVGRAFWWLGQVWVDALARLGITGAEAHHGALLCTPWSSEVCFGGVGPGEVMLAGRKVVGIAQRRTKAGALFQCAALLHWDPAPLAAALGLPAEAAAELKDVAAGLPGVEALALADAFTAALP